MPITGARGLSAAHRLFGEDPPSTLIIAAHPDDEVIGAAAALMHLRQRAAVLHVTDGAPRNLEDATRAGFESAESYAKARHAESLAALALVPGVRLLDCLGIADQTAARCLPRLAASLIDVVKALRPDIILTHAFEGGHPDHDAVAFAAANAAGMLGITMLEMSGYFDGGADGMATNRFAHSHPSAYMHALNGRERSMKRRMLGCFRTQARTLARFGTSVEQYRGAPAYNFADLPNGGRVLYDRYDWGLRSSEWPVLAAEAQQQLAMIQAVR